MRTTSRPQRTQRSGVASPSISNSNISFPSPHIWWPSPQLTAHVPRGRSPKFCRLVALLQNCFCPYRWPDLSQLGSMTWHGWHGDPVTRWPSHAWKLRLQNKRKSDGGEEAQVEVSVCGLLITFEYQWISFLGAKGPRGPKRGEGRWVKLHIISYNMLSYTMGYNYIYIYNYP